ncbi:MAG: hypothetical protein E4H00_03490 [Myxococcales bacterium]|nr:MAG: hypothetical protein E4H00_03490 [Myxococcales bacterium]
MWVGGPYLGPFEVCQSDGQAWLRLAPGAEDRTTVWQLDVLQALARLFDCMTPYANWIGARAAKDHLKFMREHRASPHRRQDLMRLALQEKRRWQKFKLTLEAWADDYGLLGLDNDHRTNRVADIFDSVRALRAWAVPESEIWHAPHGEGELIEESVTPEYLATGWPPPVYMGMGVTPDWERLVNEQAQLCTRSLEGEWSAPTLWAAMCHLVRNADTLGIRFAMCSAEDCFNPYVAHGKREHCSKRCANRAGEQRRRLEQTLRE